MPPRCQTPTVAIALPLPRAAELAVLLQYGILCPVAEPQSLQAFLLAQPGLSRAYIETRVETIFVNAQPADHLETMVGAGDSIALSAAMPGLAGAIFRRHSLHAGLRSAPAATPANAAEPANDTSSEAPCIYLKLFNTVARDLAGPLLSEGVFLPARALVQHAGRSEALGSAAMPCRWNGRTVDREALLALLRGAATVFLCLQEGRETPAPTIAPEKTAGLSPTDGPDRGADPAGPGTRPDPCRGW